MMRHFKLDDREVADLLVGVFKCGVKRYFKISEATGRHYTYPLRQHLMQLGIPKIEATALMAAADIPYAKYIRNEKPKKPAPVEITAEERAKQLALEEKTTKKLAAEEASISKRYSLVRQGNYHGVYDEENGSQVLFHTIQEAEEHIRDLIHGRDSFRIYYSSITKTQRSPELQEAQY